MCDTELKLQRIAALLPLLRQLTIKQVIDAGDAAIDAAGLNPWCFKEGLAEGTDRAVSDWRINEAIAVINTMPRQPDPQVTALVEALERINSQSVCVALRHNAAEADEWLVSISEISAAALAALQEQSK